MLERLKVWLCSDRGWCITGYAIASIAVLVAIGCMGYSIPKPLIGPHSFRQTQNAICSYYSVKEHAAIYRNIMPVLGKPWDLPTEFPFFQYAAGCLHWVSGLPLDAVGRSLSAACWAACVAASVWLLRILGFPARDTWIPIIVLVSSPLYLFWGATFMMETMALLFSLMFLVGATRCSQHMSVFSSLEPRASPVWQKVFLTWFAFSAAMGVFASAQKASTWVIAYGIAMLLSGLHSRHLTTREALLRNLWLVPLFVIPYAIARAWLEYGDSLKRLNPFARDMFVFGNQAFQNWNYGTWEQKLNPLTWSGIFLHMRQEIFIAIPPFDHLALLVCLGACAICARRYVPLMTIFGIGFIAGPLIFTNLYYVHNYYLTATGLWLLLAVSIGLMGLAAKSQVAIWPRLVSVAATCAIGVAGFVAWATTYVPILAAMPTHKQLRDSWTSPVQHCVPEPRTLLVVGNDWNPIALYYAERKGIAWPDNMLGEFPGIRLAESIALLTKEEAVGAVVFDNRLLTEANQPAIARILDRLGMVKEGLQTPFGAFFVAVDLSSSKPD